MISRTLYKLDSHGLYWGTQYEVSMLRMSIVSVLIFYILAFIRLCICHDTCMHTCPSNQHSRAERGDAAQLPNARRSTEKLH